MRERTTRQAAGRPTGDAPAAVRGAAIRHGAVAPPIVHDVLRSPDEALDPPTQTIMASHFGHDFSALPIHSMVHAPSRLTITDAENAFEREARDRSTAPALSIQTDSPDVRERHQGIDLSRVRVHTDTTAAESARVVGALAYTVGRDVVFASGQYAPRTPPGQRLLAHELTHVAQNRNASNPAVLQRYESPEHQDLGDQHLYELFAFIQTDEGRRWAEARGIDPLQVVKDMKHDPTLNGRKIKVRADLELTPGDIIALMGDFYATWQDLQNAPRQEIDEILATMQKERGGRIDANAEYERVTKGRYTKLARINTSHFAPKNKDAWNALHLEAIDKAKRAGGSHDEDLYQEALFIDAAGSHFLTDAFAAGHLFDSAKVEVAIAGYLQANPIRAENPEMQTVLGGLQMVGLAASLALKNIHDRMNAEGFEITNAKGAHWTTYGDNHLKNAEETRRIAAYAVFLSRQQVSQAKEGKTPDPAEVLNLLPDAKSVQQATDRAYAYIPVAVKEITPLIHRNVGMLGTLHPPVYLGGPVGPFIGKSILETISDPGRKKTLEEYDRRKQIDPTTPYPTPPLLRVNF